MELDGVWFEGFPPVVRSIALALGAGGIVTLVAKMLDKALPSADVRVEQIQRRKQSDRDEEQRLRDELQEMTAQWIAAERENATLRREYEAKLIEEKSRAATVGMQLEQLRAKIQIPPAPLMPDSPDPSAIDDRKGQ